MKQIKRCFLFWQMKSLEILIDGQSECLECVRDPYIINRIIMAQINARNELRKVRASYNRNAAGVRIRRTCRFIDGYCGEKCNSKDLHTVADN